jgi:hypothetical protein
MLNLFQTLEGWILTSVLIYDLLPFNFSKRVVRHD